MKIVPAFPDISYIPDQTFEPGKPVEVDDDLARRAIGDGYAQAADTTTSKSTAKKENG